jgi:uncharacterized membrane protein YedE/YeeE
MGVKIMMLIYAVILGTLFGFVLYKIGAAEPKKIIGMLRFDNLHLTKTLLLGIGIATIGIFVGLSLSLLDPSHLSVKSAYVGVLVGGAIFGIGWALSGFCPGTGVVGAAAGRKDAWVFLIGGLIGSFIYMLLYGSLKDGILFESLGGKKTLLVTGNEKFSALFTEASPLVVALILGLAYIVIAWLLPLKPKAK